MEEWTNDWLTVQLDGRTNEIMSERTNERIHDERTKDPQKRNKNKKKKLEKQKGTSKAKQTKERTNVTYYGNKY